MSSSPSRLVYGSLCTGRWQRKNGYIRGWLPHLRVNPAWYGSPRTGLAYNVGVSDKPSRARALRAETVGLLVVALLILAILLLRSGGSIDWYAR